MSLKLNTVLNTAQLPECYSLPMSFAALTSASQLLFSPSITISLTKFTSRQRHRSYYFSSKPSIVASSIIVSPYLLTYLYVQIYAIQNHMIFLFLLLSHSHNSWEPQIPHSLQILQNENPLQDILSFLPRLLFITNVNYKPPQPPVLLNLNSLPLQLPLKQHHTYIAYLQIQTSHSLILHQSIQIISLPCTWPTTIILHLKPDILISHSLLYRLRLNKATSVSTISQEQSITHIYLRSSSDSFSNVIMPITPWDTSLLRIKYNISSLLLIEKDNMIDVSYILQTLEYSPLYYILCLFILTKQD